MTMGGERPFAAAKRVLRSRKGADIQNRAGLQGVFMRSARHLRLWIRDQVRVVLGLRLLRQLPLRRSQSIVPPAEQAALNGLP